jgi:hypothetical protein
MNNARRKRICKIADALNELKSQIDELHEEEQEAFENIPESLQGTKRYEIAENAVDMLESASLRVENAITFLEDAEG